MHPFCWDQLEISSIHLISLPVSHCKYFLFLLYMMRLNLQELFFIIHVLLFSFVNVNAPKKQDKILVRVNVVSSSCGRFLEQLAVVTSSQLNFLS